MPLQNFVYGDEFDRIFFAEVGWGQVVRQVIVDKIGNERLVHSLVPLVLRPVQSLSLLQVVVRLVDGLQPQGRRPALLL